MAKAILDKNEYKDGRIVIYRRGDIRDNSNYSVRLRIPGVKKSVVRSSRTADPIQARRFAEDLYDQLRLKVMNGESVLDYRFDKCVADYQKHLDDEVFRTEKGRKEAKAYFDNYPVRFFGSKPVAKIGEHEIQTFIDWRFKNPIRKKVVQRNSVRAELNTLRKFFKWAKQKKIISDIPEIEKPRSIKARRPHFNEHDWQRLVRQAREFPKHNNPAVVRNRTMLVNYVLVLGNSGLRIGEARNLKWRDINETIPPKNSGEPIHVTLYVNGKTGPREVVARTPDIKKFFGRIRDLRRKELNGKEPHDDSLVFCHPDGRPVQSFKKGFDAFIKFAKVERDSHGHRRTLYSIRHTYATFRLMHGTQHYALAKNMGTSVAMLEAHYGHTSNPDMALELTKNAGHRPSAKTRLLDWNKV